jgi:hypothetical protein
MSFCSKFLQNFDEIVSKQLTHACDLSILKALAGGLQIGGQSGLHRETLSQKEKKKNDMSVKRGDLGGGNQLRVERKG